MSLNFIIIKYYKLLKKLCRVTVILRKSNNIAY